MKVGIIAVFVDYNRRGEHHRGLLQPQIGPLIAALLPDGADVHVLNDTWDEPDWSRDYDLLFISCLHSDFDRARQISHYWRRRGAKTVFGGILASTYPAICRPFFDAVVIGDAEGVVAKIYDDARRGALEPVYLAPAYDPARLPVPRFDLVCDRQVLPLSFEATRGCPFACHFCGLTAIGTRFHVRPVELVVRDILEGQRMLRGRVAAWKRVVVAFVDNNLGGNLPYLDRLCRAIAPLRLRWGAALTFNCIADPAVVKTVADAGCRFLFVGLESFNPAALADMRKHQNVVDAMRRALDCCRAHGILVLSGLLLNPEIDSADYIRSIPDRLTASGLHVPTFIGFESPIPGTPIFDRLAAVDGAFLPEALLRDFNGYTLVQRPRTMTPDAFVAEYEGALHATYSVRARIRKLVDDVPRLLEGGRWDTALTDIAQMCIVRPKPRPDRTYLAGSEPAPPETLSVPLTDGDFDSAEQRDAIMRPMRVTDEQGRVLAPWRSATTVFDRAGRIAPAALRLLAPA
jgi:Radical SAM superfamily